jgi:hypothetical protein
MTSEVKRLLTGFQHDMAGTRKDINGASHAWEGMGAVLAKSRRGGPMKLKVDAGEGATTVEEAVGKKGKSKKGRGKVKGKKRE